MGTSRHFAAAQQCGRIWSEADVNHRAGFMSSRPAERVIVTIDTCQPRAPAIIAHPRLAPHVLHDGRCFDHHAGA
jgi:hypothetical protein